jgi:galactose-1-phosphate uridylyltransferase
MICDVATMGCRNYIPMTEFSHDRIQQALQLAMDFFRRIEEIKHPEGVYHLINWNYMPVAGSSLIHPHLQVFSTSSAPNLMREELEAARKYMEINGSNYWDDLVAAETAHGVRFLGCIGRINWLSAFAPMGIAGDVLAVVSNARCTLELTGKDLADISEGLVCAMRAYDRMGIYGFNMSFFSGAASDDFAGLHLVFSPRATFNQALNTPDINSLRHIYNETLCMEFPEVINKMLKSDFS